MIQKFLTVIIVVLLLIYGCAGVKNGQKPDQKPEQKPVPPVEEKIEQPKKEDLPPLQPPAEALPKPSLPSTPPPVSAPPKESPPPQPLISSPPPMKTAKIVWDSVNLREGPGLNYKVIGNAKKGTSLIILDEKGNWLKVRLQDGNEAWVSKAATSEASKSQPAGTPKPKPM